MVLRIFSFIPAAWATFIAFYLDLLNKDPHKHDLGPDSTLVLSICIALLNLCIAVPIRGVRFVATLVFFGVSSPREFRPEALLEPYMNLSAHTAPTMEPRRTPICQCANNRESRRDIRAIQCVALRR
jgi:hypothetical protein